jgi:hypothetical protein
MSAILGLLSDRKLGSLDFQGLYAGNNSIKNIGDPIIRGCVGFVYLMAQLAERQWERFLTAPESKG